MVRLKGAAGDGAHARCPCVTPVKGVRGARPRIRGLSVGVATVGVAPTALARVAAAPPQALPLAAAAPRGREGHPPVTRRLPSPLPEVPPVRPVVHAPRPTRAGATRTGQVAPEEVGAPPPAVPDVVAQTDALMPARTGAARAPVHAPPLVAAVPAQTLHGVATRRRLPRPGVPHQRKPAVRVVAGVPPVLAVATLVAFQVAEAAVGAPLPLLLVGAPAASLASGLRRRAGAALLAPPEVAVPGRPFGPGPRRSGLPPGASPSVGGGPKTPMQGAGAGLLRVLQPVARRSLETVVHAPDATGTVIRRTPRPPRRPLRWPHARVILRGKLRARARRGRGLPRTVRSTSAACTTPARGARSASSRPLPSFRRRPRSCERVLRAPRSPSPRVALDAPPLPRQTLQRRGSCSVGTIEPLAGARPRPAEAAFLRPWSWPRPWSRAPLRARLLPEASGSGTPRVPPQLFALVRLPPPVWARRRARTSPIWRRRLLQLRSGAPRSCSL